MRRVPLSVMKGSKTSLRLPPGTLGGTSPPPPLTMLPPLTQHPNPPACRCYNCPHACLPKPMQTGLTSCLSLRRQRPLARNHRITQRYRATAPRRALTGVTATQVPRSGLLGSIRNSLSPALGTPGASSPPPPLQAAKPLHSPPCISSHRRQLARPPCLLIQAVAKPCAGIQAPQHPRATPRYGATAPKHAKNG